MPGPVHRMSDKLDLLSVSFVQGPTSLKRDTEADLELS